MPIMTATPRASKAISDSISSYTDVLLSFAERRFFSTRSKSWSDRQKLCLSVKIQLEKKRTALVNAIRDEIRFTETDATREVDRAIRTFHLAGSLTQNPLIIKRRVGQKLILEQRIPRGPLLAITPFSSPVSSPAHKIAAGILIGTSILWKPAKQSRRTAVLFYKCLRDAGATVLVEIFLRDSVKDVRKIIKDERIGIVSFTGAYVTGKKIIQAGGIKKYHMELSGGNAAVIFLPDFQKYNSTLLTNLVEAIIAKNGERCVSVKHIFLPATQRPFIKKLISNLRMFRNPRKSNDLLPRLGPMISESYAKKSEHAVGQALDSHVDFINNLPFFRAKNFVFPAAYTTSLFTPKQIHSILSVDIPGPIVFIYFYTKKSYGSLFKPFQNDYIQSGLQLSLFTNSAQSIQKATQSIFWGGIIINDMPTFRDDRIPFGGFGKAGLGKESFFETLTAFTDPQIIAKPKNSPQLLPSENTT